MPDGFISLAFGFCASLVIEGNQDLVAFGYQSQGECVAHLFLGDSHGETVTISGHSVGVTMLDGGAEVSIDELRFVIPKTDRI
jgi:hypothetical protein